MASVRPNGSARSLLHCAVIVGFCVVSDACQGIGSGVRGWRPCISVSGLREASWEEASATSHVSEPWEMQMAFVLYGPRRLGRPARDGIGDSRTAWSDRTRFQHLGQWWDRLEADRIMIWTSAPPSMDHGAEVPLSPGPTCIRQRTWCLLACQAHARCCACTPAGHLL